VVLALIAASIVVTSAAVMLGMAGRPVSVETVFASILVLAGALVLLRNIIVRALVGLLIGWQHVAEEEEEPPGAETEELLDAMLQSVRLALDSSTGEEYAGRFIIWALIERIRERIAPWMRGTVIVFHDHGMPYDAYPEDLAAELAVEDTVVEPRTEDDITVMIVDNVIEVWLSSAIIEKLRSEALRGEDAGEIFRVRSQEIAKILYKIGKEIYKALNPGVSEELAAYVAYKTLIQLEKEGVIKFEQKLSMFKIEKKDIILRIRKQIEEEESLNTGRNKTQA